MAAPPGNKGFPFATMIAHFPKPLDTQAFGFLLAMRPTKLCTLRMRFLREYFDQSCPDHITPPQSQPLLRVTLGKLSDWVLISRNKLVRVGQTHARLKWFFHDVGKVETHCSCVVFCSRFRALSQDCVSRDLCG